MIWKSFCVFKVTRTDQGRKGRVWFKTVIQGSPPLPFSVCTCGQFLFFDDRDRLGLYTTVWWDLTVSPGQLKSGGTSDGQDWESADDMALVRFHTIPGRPEQRRRVDESGGNWCRGGEVGKGPEEEIACAGRARAILSEMSYELPPVLTPGGPVPLLAQIPACSLLDLLWSVYYWM